MPESLHHFSPAHLCWIAGVLFMWHKQPIRRLLRDAKLCSTDAEPLCRLVAHSFEHPWKILLQIACAHDNVQSAVLAATRKAVQEGEEVSSLLQEQLADNKTQAIKVNIV